MSKNPKLVLLYHFRIKREGVNRLYLSRSSLLRVRPDLEQPAQLLNITWSIPESSCTKGIFTNADMEQKDWGKKLIQVIHNHPKGKILGCNHLKCNLRRPRRKKQSYLEAEEFCVVFNFSTIRLKAHLLCLVQWQLQESHLLQQLWTLLHCFLPGLQGRQHSWIFITPWFTGGKGVFACDGLWAIFRFEVNPALSCSSSDVSTQPPHRNSRRCRGENSLQAARETKPRLLMRDSA